MYLKVNSIFKITCCTIASIVLLSGCSTTGNRGQNQHRPVVSEPGNAFTVPGQIVADNNIKSINLFRKGTPGSAPIIRLKSNEQFRLSFDIIENENRQFRIEFTHHNPDWSRSSLPPDFFLSGFTTNRLTGGSISQAQRPSYRHYQYDFPNQNFSFERSGNYMIRVTDSDSGMLIFTLPFYVVENEGQIVSSVESFPVPRENMRIIHRPVSRYNPPDFVDQPQFDLEFYFVQNRFWGRNRRAGELDFSNPENIQFELAREHAFIGDYEFNSLMMNNISGDNPQILEFNPADIPPEVVLRDDVRGFSSSGTRSSNLPGSQDADLNAMYADVTFRFDPEETLSDGSEIYLVGDFNNWAIQFDNRLRFDSSVNRWVTSTVIKEGQYNYKYVLMENNRINDLHFDDLFTENRQEYHAFVYMRDSRQFAYRLLQIQSFYKGS